MIDCVYQAVLSHLHFDVERMIRTISDVGCGSLAYCLFKRDLKLLG